MKAKNGIVVLSFWTLLLAPFLCGVGVLVHSCICEESSECRHELSCSTDPCQILAVGLRSDDTRPEDLLNGASLTGAAELVEPATAPQPSLDPQPVVLPSLTMFCLTLSDGSLPLLC